MANILASLNCTDETHLLIGISGLTYTRVRSSLDSGASPIVITNDTTASVPDTLKVLEREGRVTIINRLFDIECDLQTLGRAKVGKIVDRVFVILSANHMLLKRRIFEKCQIYRIPINTSECAELSTFTMLSSYTDGNFQMGITTSGKGCRLANRIKRELIPHIPKNIGAICERVGQLRERIQYEDRLRLLKHFKSDYEQILQNELGEHEEDSIQTSKLNNFISEFNMSEVQKKLQRSRWLSQVVEYYPFDSLANLSIEDLSNEYYNPKPTTIPSLNDQSLVKTGSISLVGAGPGSLSSLTLGAFNEITTADIVLADKLVPQQVIDLIPSKTEIFIARKFPGNAEAAQEELLTLSLNALKQGKKVVRLKQGDPYIFGRGGEEFIYFQQHGFKPVVLPGITSALSSTVSSMIPTTQRDVADQVLICTGTGRKGALPNIPEFVKSRTTIFLMALHRIDKLVPELIEKGWDLDIPAAIVERSSCPDQRVTRTKLRYLIEAIEEIGSRPPGLLILGHVCEVLSSDRIGDGKRWTVEEGYDESSDGISGIIQTIR